MAEALTLRIITPETIVQDTTATSIRLPAADGSMGILPRHASMITALDTGLLIYQHEGQERTIFVSGGFAEVRDNTVRVVSDAGERPSDIDCDRAKEAEARARERLDECRKASGTSQIDLLRAEAALRRALLRQKAYGRRRSS
jgi:F-type H+-transporting ATPase subunit epsilon